MLPRASTVDPVARRNPEQYPIHLIYGEGASTIG